MDVFFSAASILTNIWVAENKYETTAKKSLKSES